MFKMIGAYLLIGLIVSIWCTTMAALDWDTEEDYIDVSALANLVLFWPIYCFSLMLGYWAIAIKYLQTKLSSDA